jgi:hypothetical protein
VTANNGVQTNFIERGRHRVSDVKGRLQSKSVSVRASLGKHRTGKIEANRAMTQLAGDESHETRTCSYVEYVSRWCRQKSLDRSNPRCVLSGV